MIDKVQVAATYARERGWEVFPTHPETDALPEDWEHRATAEPVGVRELWAEEHADGNPALKCGPRSGVLVLNVDPRQGGDALLDRLERELGRLPETLIARTGGGGLHLFFRWIDLGRAVLEPWGEDAGLEIRAGTDGESSFVWLPPTTREKHDGRPYEWRNPETPVAELPATWVAAAKGERVERGPGEAETWNVPEAEGRTVPIESAAGDREEAKGAPSASAERPVEAEPTVGADRESPSVTGTEEESPPWARTEAEEEAAPAARVEEDRSSGAEARPPAREETGPAWTPGDLIQAFRGQGTFQRTSPMLGWKGAMTCLLGEWNSGTSTLLASDLAAVVRKGLEGGQARRVLWITEMPKGQTARYVANAGLEVPELTEAGERGLLKVIGLRGTPHASWDDLEAEIAAFEPDMIYVDTLSALLNRFAQGGAPAASDAAAWERYWDTRFADWTRRWAREGLVVADRVPEAHPGELAGSQGKTVGVDVALCLLPGDRGHGDVRVVQAVGGRGVRAGKKTYARFLESGDYGRYVPLTPEQARELESREPGVEPEDAAQPYIRIVEAVEANPGALSSELYERVRGREKAFRSIRDELVDWNLIEDRSGRADPGHSWYLAEGVDPRSARETILRKLGANVG